jgi:hypothetical protein
VQRARCLGVGEGARVLELGVIIDVGEEMVLADVVGHGRRPRASTESVSETSVACVVEAEEDGRVSEECHKKISEECHKKMGEQASAAGHGGRWPMTTSDERLGAGENR